MKALLHVHSTYSHDGQSSLEELSAWGEARGLQAIFLTEHTNTFDREKMSRFVAHCETLTRSACRLVPGLEFPVRGGFHLLGFNVTRFEPVVDPLAATRFIRDQGGLAVLAHPARYNGSWPEHAVLSALDGIEVWNARYDGRFVPSGRVMASVAAVMSGHGHLARYCGQDLHAIQVHRLLLVTANAESVVDLVDCLRRGTATMGATGVRLPMRGKPGPLASLAGRVVYPAYEAVRAMRDSLSHAARP